MCTKTHDCILTSHLHLNASSQSQIYFLQLQLQPEVVFCHLKHVEVTPVQVFILHLELEALWINFINFIVGFHNPSLWILSYLGHLSSGTGTRAIG
jgi:hypothetical protein